MSNIKWKDDEIKRALELISQGKSFKDIGLDLNKSQISVTAKLNRLGYKSEFNKRGGNNKGKTKYKDYDWSLIQAEYNNNLSYEELLKKFKLSTHAVIWAKRENKLTLRTVSEGLKIAWKKGKYKGSQQDGFKRYRQLCDFKFSLNDYPDRFNFQLVKEYGWYKAKNRGDNPNGVNRDHMYSVKDGYVNNIDPLIISHPANCQLLTHTDNIKKKSKSVITLEELKQKIKNWN